MSIRLENLQKRFGDTLVVDEVSLEVADRELFVLLGASGSGKSTVLRLIAGLLEPDSGRIDLHGRDVTALPPQERGAGFVFQNYSIFRHMNVAENVEFGLKIRKVPAAERAARREELLHLVNLAGLGNRYASQLSGGQQQRVALARALAYEPAVLLLDEPFSALDVKIRGQLRRTLKVIQQQLGVTTILVTHDQEEAFELGDRIGVMERGKILEVGRPEELYHRPRSPFVATFLGSGSVLAAQVSEGSARLGPLALPVPDETYDDGARVQVLIRPEQVVVSTGSQPPQGPVLGRAEVIEQIFAGSVRRLRLQLPRLPGTRQVAPPLPFGEEQMVLEAELAGADSLPEQVWVALRGWHILERPQLQLLVYDHGAGDTSALETAGQLACALPASITVLSVVANPDRQEALQSALAQRLPSTGLSGVETVVATGKTAEEVVRQLHTVWYDYFLTVEDEPPGRLGDAVSAALDAGNTPVFILRGPARPLKRLMICTAAGEPGKSDVRTGGFLARRLDASVLLLHTRRPDAPGSQALAQRHMERALATLRGLETTAQGRLELAEEPAQTILRVAQEEDVDLIVIGRHWPELRLRLVEDNIMHDVAAHARLPVLVVPEL